MSLYGAPQHERASVDERRLYGPPQHETDVPEEPPFLFPRWRSDSDDGSANGSSSGPSPTVVTGGYPATVLDD
ncbi:hypothetical protein [Halegenticoccus tardaugens]|uniref:hypothetical protein n=1 Tax=Halegenticoccus tardaugens TaxID=2071624 RepID=UPI00100A2B90|nr:hypothetical protein [Halegenticoccus tardaugens]